MSEQKPDLREIHVTKERVMELYYSHTIRRTCEILGITRGALDILIRRYGIERKGRGRSQSKYRRAKIVIDDPENAFIPKVTSSYGVTIPLEKEEIICYPKK